MLEATVLLFIIQNTDTIGVNIVKTTSVNCLIINLIFIFTNKYANSAITIAVAIAFPVLILVNREFPSKSSKLPCAFDTNIVTKLLFSISINFTNIGANIIADAPKNNLIKLSFTSFLLSGLIPAIIIFHAKITIAINIGPPIILAIVQYQLFIKFHVSIVNGDIFD